MCDSNRSEKLDGLEPGYVHAMVEQTKLLMSSIQDHLSSDGEWLFGLEQASALDAHLVPFIARMRDVGRYEIVPSSLQKYAEEAQKTEEWKTVMQGRSTVPWR